MATIFEELGWEHVAALPGTLVHKRTKARLAVFVDDLLMTTPPFHERDFWKALEARINFDEKLSEVAKFLRAHHDLSKRDTMTTSKVQMRVFLRDAIAHNLEETGEKSLSVARTPYFLENFSPKAGDEPRTLQLSHHYLHLLAARLAKPDFVVAIMRLASKITSWKKATTAHCVV